MLMIPVFTCLGKIHSLISIMNTEDNRIVVWLKSVKLTLNTQKPFSWFFTVVEESNIDLFIDNVKIKEL